MSPVAAPAPAPPAIPTLAAPTLPARVLPPESGPSPSEEGNDAPRRAPDASRSLDAHAALADLTPDQLRNLVVDLQTRQSLGLYWERNVIAHDRALNANYPFVRLVDHDAGRRLHADAPDGAPGAGWDNLVIEGDNFDALRLLRLTHRGAVRVILIDPPYNTGNKDWVYNDRFVRKEDRFRASQWLEFLYRRLVLARDLLTDDGVMLVCINDENRAKLELLMDQVFEGRRVGSFVWKTRSGSNDAGDHSFSVDHEHVLVYARPGFEFAGPAKDLKQYKSDDGDGRGPWKTGDLSTPVHYRDKRAGNAYYPLEDPDTGIWYPCNPNRVWAYASERLLKPGAQTKRPTMEEWVRRRKIVFPPADVQRAVTWHTRAELDDAITRGDVPRVNRGRTPLLTADLPDLDAWVGRRVGFERPWFKRHRSDLKSATGLVSSWIRGKTEKPDAESGGGGTAGRPAVGAAPADAALDPDLLEVVTQRSGTSEDSVKEILGEHAFNFPKPPSLIRELLRYTTDREDLVLDFFAGSGTTGHAVLALNAEDDGARRFILVSSTEATDEAPDRNVCRDVCAERVRRVIAGYGDTPGLGGDFAYGRVERVDAADLAYDVDPELVFTSLRLRHGGGATPYPRARVNVVHEGEDALTLFCPAVDEQTLAELCDTVRTRRAQRVRVYSDRPTSAADALHERLGDGVAVESRAALDAVAPAGRER